jgi:hypothetical protein
MRTKKGQVQYKVKWEGMEDLSWDTLENCDESSQNLIDAYVQSNSSEGPAAGGLAKAGVKSLKVAELRAALTERGLPTDGVKATLVKRLQAAI